MFTLLTGGLVCALMGGEPAERPPIPTAADADFLFDEGTIIDLDLRMDERSMDAIDVMGGEETFMTVTWAGKSWLVGAKLKGSSTFRHLHGKPSFKIDFGQWLKHQTFNGIRRITLNSMVFDETMLREHTAYELLRRMGVPAPRHGYARVTFNGEDYGLYGLVETLDEDFLARNFPGNDAGNLYDTTFNFADLTGMGEPFFELQEGTPGSDDLHRLIGDLGGGDMLGAIRRNFDDSVLSMLAVELAAPNWDSYTRNTNNYLLYHALPSDRWYMIPWGQDQAFKGGGGVYQGLLGRLATACAGQTACRDELDARITEVLDTWESTDLLGYVNAAADLIRADCEDDPKAEQGCNMDKQIEQVRERPEAIRSGGF